MFDRLLDWILGNPDTAGMIAGAVIVILLAAVATLRATGSLRQGLLALMLQADRARRHGQLGPIDGPQVMELVIQAAMASLVPKLPLWLRLMVTADKLRTTAQRLYDLSLDYLDDGVLNGTKPEDLE
jgi:hypothetical protein